MLEEALNSLGRVFRDTPLHASLQTSCDALKRSEFLEGHFAALAAVRAALQGVLFVIYSITSVKC